jgi:hypothetical protein
LPAESEASILDARLQRIDELINSNSDIYEMKTQRNKQSRQQQHTKAMRRQLELHQQVQRTQLSSEVESEERRCIILIWNMYPDGEVIAKHKLSNVVF